VDDDDLYQFTTSILLKRTELVNKIILFSDGLKAITFLKEQLENIENIPDILF